MTSAMRKKELKLVVTFHTTSEAMAMERICRKTGAPGRLIPVPREISAGCGLAWCAPPESRENLLELMSRVGLEKEAIHTCPV